MTQVSSAKPTIAVIGLGNIGKVVATNLIKGKRAVIIADRNDAKAKQFAAELANLEKQQGAAAGSLVRVLPIAEAVWEADIVIPAVWFQAIPEVLGQYAGALKGKIIIDVSNPIAPDGKGGFSKLIGEKESAGEQIAAGLPAGARLVKALGTLSAANLAGAAFRQPDRVVLFYAADDRGVDASIEELIHDSGFEPVRVGGLGQSIRIEVFGDLHEYGALGKLVTREEATARV